MTDAITSLGLAATPAPTAKATGSASLDQAAFLKLMTAQLNAQDPLNPMDNQAFVAQLAQFSSVAGIAEMNSSLKSLAASLGGSRLGDAASWIGRSALAPGDTAVARADGSYAGEIALPEAATDLTLTLTDGNGQVVHSEDLGAQKAGSVPFAWDGKDAAGAPVAGPLTVRVAAAGTTKAPTIATWLPITGVQSPAAGGTQTLTTPLGSLAATDALKLS